MLSTEHYTQVLLLLLFVVSMLGSIERSDINSTYSLFSYMFIASYRYRTALDSILTILLLVTVVVIGADAWSFLIMIYEPISVVGRMFGYIVIIVEILFKIIILIVVACWRFGKSSKDTKDENNE